MLIKEVEPITEVGTNLLEKENAQEIIAKVVELPLQKACNIFLQKGIETVMSSANKNNVLPEGEKPVEREDIAIQNMHIGGKGPAFDEVGKGYAWIMLNFDTLSDENKDWLFDLEARKGQNGEHIGGKAIWFVQPCVFGDIEYALRVGKFSYDFVRQVMPESDIPPNIQVDQRLAEFEKRHTIVGYNWRNISEANGSFTYACK